MQLQVQNARRRRGIVERGTPSEYDDSDSESETPSTFKKSNVTLTGAEPITKYPEGDERFDLFSYLATQAVKYGACRENYVTLNTSYKKLKKKLKNHTMELKDDYGQTALHLAVQYCTVDVVTMLLDKGADVNATDDFGYTPLFYTAMSNNAVTASTLIDRGADITARDSACGRGALHIAAMYGSFVVVKLLLDGAEKCDINGQDDLGLTPMALAAYYRHSTITTYFVSMGADPFVTDNGGISSAIRIAYSMPVVIRDIFDGFCKEEIMKGLRRYHLEKILRTEKNIKTSLFQFLVWQGNLGIVEHPFFKYLTETKWALYGEKPTYRNLGGLAIVTSIWTGLYMITDISKSESKYQRWVHLGMYIASFICYLQRLRMNTLLMRRRHTYMMHAHKVTTQMDKLESAVIHPKGKRLVKTTREAHKAKKTTFIDDIKKAPSVITDLMIDHILLFYLAIKVLSNFIPFIASIENIIGATAIIFHYGNIFLKCQIMKSIGPFVVYMKYVPSDLYTVFTMFVALFVPAVIVFYKTIFRIGGVEADPVTDISVNITEADALNVVRRAANKGGSGGATDYDYEPISFIGTFFTVLRMVLVDYEYEDGQSRSDPPVWWMLISIIWIIFSSIVVLNLMIAVMADSYTRMYERSEISCRVRRAQTIADIEKAMRTKELAKAIKGVYEKSPVEILFDPVCDRDKIEIVEAKVQVLSAKLNRLEQTVNAKLFLNLQRKLETIESKVKFQQQLLGNPTNPSFNYT